MMKDTTKYFTPDIEDIRVGYECEVGENDLWLKGRIKEQTLTQAFSARRNNMIRVPYLTKEQIEAEGWESKGSKDYFLFGYDVHQNFHMAFEKGDYVIQGRALFGSHHVLKIFDRSDQEGAMCIFEGECKDINTFRYICKLLGIG